MISQSFPRCPGPPTKKSHWGLHAHSLRSCRVVNESKSPGRSWIGRSPEKKHLQSTSSNINQPFYTLVRMIPWNMNNMNKWWHGDKPWVLHCQISRRAKVTSHQHLCPHETGQALNSRHRELTLPPSAAGGSATNAMALTLARHMQEIMEIIVDLVPVGVTLADSWSYCQLLLFGHVMACLKMGLSSGHL